MVLQRNLNANSIIAWSREQKKRLQIVENRVWRQILGAPVYTPLSLHDSHILYMIAI